MANDAVISVQATVLPDEIQKVISGSLTVTQGTDNQGDKWYYQLTQVRNSTDQLIENGSAFIDVDAIATGGSPATIATGDKVKFLFIKNTDTSNDVYVALDTQGTVTTSLVDAIKIPANSAWFANIPNTTVADLTCVTSSSTVNCVVAALINDIA